MIEKYFIFENITLVIFAYLLGSIPSAVWIGRKYFGKDVRDFGSGNAGATNTFRVFGKKAGSIVLVLDILKGILAVNLVYLSSNFEQGSELFINFKMLLGLFAILGHIFPIFAKFKGGKGVATLVGIIFSINPTAALLTIAAFAIFFIAFNYVSLASVISAFLFPFFMYFVVDYKNEVALFYGIVLWIIILITHQKNVQRLLNQEESKMILFKKKRS